MIRILVPFDFDQKYGFFLKEDYFKSLKQLGVDVVPQLYCLQSAKENLKNVHGLLLPGGAGDVDPRLYGETRVHEKTQINRKRCDFELELIEKAKSQNLPILGICFGFQILNVYYGGSLYQHIPDEFPSTLTHEQEGISSHPIHQVSLTDAARDLAGKDYESVNSTHHQGVKDLAGPLECLGRAEDNLVEVFRDPRSRFVWGVQWHPERLQGDWVVPSFVKACQRSD